MLLRLRWLVTLAVAGMLTLRAWGLDWFPNVFSGRNSKSAPLHVEYFEPGWRLETFREMPERVSAITASSDRDRTSEEVYVGTGPSGSIYRSCSYPGSTVVPIAVGLGDQVRFGTCEVSSLAVRDLDHDGIPELVAETSQVRPIGRPRIYVWSLQQSPVLRGVALPNVASSWSHGLGFMQASGMKTDSIISTFCGHGEIVEYRLDRDTSSSGFHHESISWRQLGKLPTSGEQALAADADNDGELDLCFANGYAPGKAAIQIYSWDEQGLADRPKHVIDENGRFGNVRFLVGNLMGNGSQDLMAWWCTGDSFGDCEIIRYRIRSDGIHERTVVARGDAGELWPRDGQMTLADLSRKGVPEVWFITNSGTLWRYDPIHSSPLTHVCNIKGQIGPLACSAGPSKDRPSLYVGRDRFVLQFQATDPN